MPVLETINTADPQYQVDLNHLRRIHVLARPWIDHLHRLPEDRRPAFLESHAQLRELIEFVEWVNDG